MSTNTFSADEDAGEDDLLILESNEAAEDDTELTLESNEAAEDDGALVLESNEATGGDDVGMSDNDDEDDMLILESNQCRAAPQRVRGEAFALEANDARAASDDDGVGASTSMDPGTSATPTETRWLVIHRPMVVIRASPSVRAPVLGMRMAGTDVRVVEACDGWLRIAPEGAQDERALWMLLDGRQANIQGPLLRRMQVHEASAIDDARSRMQRVAATVNAGTSERPAARHRLDESVRELLAAQRSLQALPEDVAELERVLICNLICIAHAKMHPASLFDPLSDPSRLSVSPRLAHSRDPDLHRCAWEIVFTASEGARFSSKSAQAKALEKVLENIIALLLIAVTALGWLEFPKPIGSSALIDRLFSGIDARRTRAGADKSARKDLLASEIVNLSAALLDDGQTLRNWTAAVVRMVSTVEGRAELVEQGLAREVDVQACSPADFAAISPETLFSFATGQHTTRLSPRASAAHNATLWTVYIGLVHAIKKRYERGMAQRLTLGEGETGGRYRCVAPERVFRPGLPSLMNDAHVETLRRERIVVVDGVLPKDALELARAEAQVMARSGHLKGEPNASCNPGEVSLEMDLSDPRDLSNLQRSNPGLYQCITSLWNLPSLLGPKLGLAVRVPQTVLLASYPPGALYHRHFDSYSGTDIPRLLTVLLYLSWDPQQGGQLRALNPGPGGKGEPRDIDPSPGRLVVFYAQEVEHMVLPSMGERFALTLWIWDVKKDSSGR